MTTVYLVDDHRIFLTGVQAELADSFEVVGSSYDVDAAVDAIRSLQPDVVLVDVHMPGGGGVTVVGNVLQTLALIQRTDDPKRMVTLARSQERELRSWLFDEQSADTQTLRGAIADAANRVEEAHDVPVSVVVVGEDQLPPDRRAALVGAATEAMMNAAKHSGADRISVFAEATDDSVEIFVTDQGKGFDLEAVEKDRRGITESIEGRMQRHGGSAVFDSELGVGTEVHLTMSGGTP